MEGSQINASLQQGCCTNTADKGRLESQHCRATCSRMRKKSFRRRLSNGRQITTRCVLVMSTSARGDLVTTVTAKRSQTAVLGKSDCRKSTMNIVNI